MSEYDVMNCDEFSGAAAELALGVLTGRERADALAHLERCDACRETVRQLAMAGEELTGLLPAVEPPAGFELRVMARIGVAPGAQAGRHRRRRLPSLPRLLALPRRPRAGGGRLRADLGRPRRLLAVAAVTLTVAAGLGGWGLRAATSGSPASLSTGSVPLTSAALTSVGHRAVGEVFYYAGSQRWIYMSVDVPSGSGTVTCQLEGSDGRYTTVGSFSLADGYGAWGGPALLASRQVTGARLVGPGGKVLGTARFS